MNFLDDGADFINYVKESIASYVDCAKSDKDPYPEIFDSEYELYFKMDIQ